MLKIALLLGLLNLGLGAHVGGIRRLGLPPPPPVTHKGIVDFVEQKVDNFNDADDRVWLQRYFMNDEYYKDGGPVFLFVDGEGTSSPGWLSSSAMIDNAKIYGAAAYQIEHRFYGQSHPLGNISTENLAYLSSEQALADIANFIKVTNNRQNYPNGTKWVAFGGSYAGSLAAWVRLKYPDLIHAAVSSSGPLLAIADFADYYRVVAESLRQSSEECFQAIHKSTVQFTEAMETEDGRNDLYERFLLCSPIDLNNTRDVYNLYSTISSIFAGTVQYDSKNIVPLFNIETACDVMTDESRGTELNRLALLSIYNYGLGCLNYNYDTLVDYYQQSVQWAEESFGARQWMWQTCTEFGYYQTSSLNITQYLFSDKFPVEFFVQQCPDIFGEDVSYQSVYDNIDKTNKFYGGLDIDVERVVFVHGSVDPWHPLGVIDSTNPRAPSIYIQNTSHCMDMYGSYPGELPQLVEAKQQITQLLGTWLSED